MSKARIISNWFKQYSDDVYRFLVYYTGNKDVEDLVQEVFMKALKGLDSFHHQSSPKTWLFSIARNIAIDDGRKRKIRHIKNSLIFQETVVPSPEHILAEHEIHKALYGAIMSLRQSYRDVLILRGIKEFTVAETAAVLNWNEDKVRTTYSRALKALKKQRGGLQDERP
ncbi:RNA polymerase sigma factor [Halalkalibacter urbisdiaboli]|uniref:RNA polymerase sigma factor n=1 Tax=Halalkalibacter urbisdiaboli TaxID=1960589 RepID=UPI000B43CF2F|nr:RNA polymerase sigma factor [Halalkalibacter urbisdiaboli]